MPQENMPQENWRHTKGAKRFATMTKTKKRHARGEPNKTKKKTELRIKRVMRKFWAIVAMITIMAIIASNIVAWLRIKKYRSEIEVQREMIEWRDSIINKQDSLIFRWRCLYEPDYVVGEM